jgi:hypothetical protein
MLHHYRSISKRKTEEGSGLWLILMKVQPKKLSGSTEKNYKCLINIHGSDTKKVVSEYKREASKCDI